MAVEGTRLPPVEVPSVHQFEDVSTAKAKSDGTLWQQRVPQGLVAESTSDVSLSIEGGQMKLVEPCILYTFTKGQPKNNGKPAYDSLPKRSTLMIRICVLTM